MTAASSHWNSVVPEALAALRRRSNSAPSKRSRTVSAVYSARRWRHEVAERERRRRIAQHGLPPGERLASFEALEARGFLPRRNRSGDSAGSKRGAMPAERARYAVASSALKTLEAQPSKIRWLATRCTTVRPSASCSRLAAASGAASSGKSRSLAWLQKASSAGVGVGLVAQVDLGHGERRRRVHHLARLVEIEAAGGTPDGAGSHPPARPSAHRRRRRRAGRRRTIR